MRPGRGWFDIGLAMILMFVSVVFILPIACGGGGNDAGNEAEEAVSGAADAAKSAAESAGEAVMENAGASLDALKSEMMEQVSKYEGSLETLKTSARSLDNEQVNEMVDKIDTRLTAVKGTISEMKAGSIDELNQKRQEIQTQMTEVGGLFDQARSKLKELKPDIDLGDMKLPGH